MSNKLYHRKHMAQVSDLFPDYEDYSFLKNSGNVLKTYGKRTKCQLARGIFHSFMNMVMDDIVEGHQFKMPFLQGMLYVEEIPEQALEKMKQRGLLQGFKDACVSKPHIPTYRFVSTNGDAHKFRVILDKARYTNLLRNQFEGVSYSSNIGIW